MSERENREGQLESFHAEIENLKQKDKTLFRVVDVTHLDEECMDRWNKLKNILLYSEQKDLKKDLEKLNFNTTLSKIKTMETDESVAEFVFWMRNVMAPAMSLGNATAEEFEEEIKFIRERVTAN